MAKLTLSDVSNLLGNPTTAATTINANNDAIESALENTLSRDGTTPNQMAADLDMNNNDILNVDNLDVNTLSFDGVPVTADDLATIPPTVARTEDVVPHVATRADIRGLDTSIYEVVYLKEGGREGLFKWTTGDYSAQITADTAEGIYIKADAVAATSGAWVRQEPFMLDGLDPRWFGAAFNVAAPVTSSTLAVAADDTAAIQAANDLAAILGSYVRFPAGRTKAAGLRQTVTWHGSGADAWELPSSGVAPAAAKGTHLFVTGTPDQTFTVEGVTDMRVAGGWVTNPDPSTGHNDATYRILNFYNEDASGTSPATPKQLRVGVAVVEDTRNICMTDMRIVLECDGLEGLSNPDGTDLGADFDIGLLVYNSPYYFTDNVQVVGFWRMAGLADINSKIGFDSSQATTVYNNYRRSFFQGFVGVAIRGTDVFRCTAVTASTIEVPWTESNPFPTSGEVRVGSSSFAYTSVALSGDKLTLSVSSDPTGSVSVGDEVSLGTNWGATGKLFEHCVITDLAHPSRLRACHPDIGFASPSKGFEVSGYPLRSITFRNCDFFVQDVWYQIHNLTQPLNIEACYAEAVGWKASIGGAWGAQGARAIVSSAASGQSYGTYPAGSTGYINIDAATVWHFGIDFAPIAARNGSMTRYTGSGLFRLDAGRFDPIGPAGTHGALGLSGRIAPTRLRLGGPDISTGPRFEIIGHSDFTRHLQLDSSGRLRIGSDTSALASTIEAYHATFAAIRARSAGATADITLQNQDGSWGFRTNGTSLDIRQGTTPYWRIAGSSRALMPVTDNSLSLGLASNRVAQGYITQVRPGDGSVIWTSGTGSPEGVVTAPIGSLYTRTDGGPTTTLYVKTSGTSNTGWTAK